MILVVDDKEENIYSLKKLLESKDFLVDSALSGEEALKKVLNNDYALIILDVQMPIMDGFEVAETLAGFNKTKDIPIIFLSAVNTDKQFIAKGYASGGIDYVTKPVDPDILLLKVNTFLKLYKQNTELKEIQNALRAEIDIRKRVQIELKEKVEQLHYTLEALPLVAFTADENGKIDFVNQKWMLFSDSEHVFPKSHPDDKNIEVEFINTVIQNKKLEMEIRLQKLDSQEYCYHLFKAIPIKENGIQNKWIGTFTDIDAHKQIEKKKDDFLSIASHELKTPLTSIKAYIQLLSRSLKNHESVQIKTYIEKAYLQVGKLSELIADLLDISKIESGELKLNKKDTDIKDIIKSCVDTIHQTHSSANIKVLGNLNSRLLNIDEHRIEQVLLNYLTNALKYSPNNQTITIIREDLENELLIKVKDNGIGIPEEKQQKVFSKFYRVEETSLKFQGLGIGLYICADIIKKHHGRYGVKSEPNKGSAFYFSLPYHN
ncbi:hybrid sensor histidine kinase/response regulator [Pedobacter psychrophilus]|uniref:histidine kinase n=1 Tax=Pedobacter psychrophilus TaxID=1826909 RepID=A0A179DJV7_9SPHI|nr:ATP-binding protein [Pedobacter psychrophilus]OAQ40693.1 hybrid sensor histidine kinase/response regulator [Pedobacter psychrophilus]